MMKKRYKNAIHLTKYIPFLFIFGILFLTVGFAAFQNDLAINDIGATIRVQKDIRVTGVAATNSTIDTVSYWEEYSVNRVEGRIGLPYSDSTITYDVQITNIGNIEAAISEISGLPDNLTYSIDNYSLNDMLCDDLDNTKCKLGSVSTVTITIGYKNGQYDSTNTEYVFGMDFKFKYLTDAIAQIDDKLYDTLQRAVNDVPDDKTETTIILLNDTIEAVEIGTEKNIVLNLNGKNISNDGNKPVINNEGILKMLNGAITTNATANGAVNNQATGNIIIDSVSIISTGGRQALYNNKGIATIKGSSYLSSATNQRATVTNSVTGGGVLNVESGTIISTGTYAINNTNTMTIGVEGGNVDSSNPLIMGVSNGVYSNADFSFYDGVIKGKNAAISNEGKVANIEAGYTLFSYEEIIDGQNYKVKYLGIPVTVTFNPNGGHVSGATRTVASGKKIGTLPDPAKSGYEFLGWFTELVNGQQIDENTIINGTITFYAHWQKKNDVARIGDTYYDTLQDAIGAVPDNVETTINLMKDTAENIVISSSSKNIIFDFGNNTLHNAGNYAVITNNSGNVKLISGTVTSNADTAAINQNGGTFTVDGGHVVATGSRQAIYIVGGTVQIKGNSYLSSQTYGKPSGVAMERGTIQCLVGGTLIITGGNIEGLKQQAVSNEGNLTIGTKDGNINTTNPVLLGNVNGVKSTGTFNFYDGIIKGKTDTINGTINDQETNSQIVTGTETISGSVYNTTHLAPS